MRKTRRNARLYELGRSRLGAPFGTTIPSSRMIRGTCYPVHGVSVIYERFSVSVRLTSNHNYQVLSF